MVAFYISYNKSNLPYSIDIFNNILDYFRYINFKSIKYNSIKINYSFIPKLITNKFKIQKTIINDALYFYDKNNIYYDQYYNSLYKYNILLHNLFDIKYLFITILFYYNDNKIYTIKFYYSDILKQINNIKLIFDIRNFNVNNLYNFSPCNNNTNKNYNNTNYNNINYNNTNYNNTNYNNTNYNNTNKNYTNINNNNITDNNINDNNINDNNIKFILNIINNNQTNQNIFYTNVLLSLKYLIIPDIIKLF